MAILSAIGSSSIADLKFPLSTRAMSVRDGLSLGMVCVAFVVSIFHYGGDSNFWLTCTFIALLAGCLIRVQPVWSGSAFHWSAIHWWLTAYAAWLVVLVWTSTLPENSLVFARMMSALALVFVLCVNLTRDIWLRVFVAFMLAGLVSAGWGISEFVATGKRANGPIIDPSSWGSLHNLFFFGTLAVFLTARRWCWMPGATMFVFAVAVFCSYSRMATAILAAALGLIVLAGVRYPEIRGRLAASVVMAVLAFALVHSYAGQHEASHGEGYTLDLEQEGWTQRFSMWRAALALYADHPLTGSGPATFKVQYPRYRDSGDLGNLGNYVHNDYIQYLAEGGPLLLAFLLVFAGYLLYRLCRDAVGLALRGRGQLDAARLESVVLIVAMGTSLVHGLMNFVLYQLPVIMLTGLYFARTVKLAGTGSLRRLDLSKPGAARIGSRVIVLLLAGIAFLDELSNDLIYQHRFTRGIDRGGVVYFDAIRWLTILRGANSSNQFALATLYRERFDRETDDNMKEAMGLASAMRYERGLELNPFRTRVRQYYAEFLQQNPWLQAYEEVQSDPETLFRENVRLAPTFAQNRLALADYLLDAGREGEAYRVLRQWACRWGELKYPGYRELRLEVFKRLLRESRERNDTGIQRHIVNVLD